MKLAIVCDWLTNQGGAERVIESLHSAFPTAPIYTSVYNRKRLPQFKRADIRVSYLQKLPLATSHHKLFPIMRRRAFESFDLSDFDVVLSVSSAEAKGIHTPDNTTHISYILTPTRYYWSEYQRYIKQPGFNAFLDPLIRIIAPRIIPRMRRWDFNASQRPDVLVGISTAVVKRIEQYYKRPAKLIFPPVRTDRFRGGNSHRYGLLVVSRLTPYKRIDLAVLAAKKLDIELTVIGRGPELARLKKAAGPKTRFLQNVNDNDVAEALAGAKAFLFPGEEDFGITILEAAASGTPTIAYGKGGALDTVKDGITGILFNNQTVESLIAAIRIALGKKWNTKDLRNHAEEFSEAIFINKMKRLIESALANSGNRN